MTFEGGTIIHGTLLNYDLIEAFVSELEDQSVGETRFKNLIQSANMLCGESRDAINYPPSNDDSEFIGGIIGELHDALDELAPEGFYFGAHEGDGSDFGYWPVEDD